MLWTVMFVLLVMWALGMAFGIAGMFVHVLLVAAVVILFVQVLHGRQIC